MSDACHVTYDCLLLQINLLLDEKELEKALQDDRKLLATILQSDII